jgi:hypothetical protein
VLINLLKKFDLKKIVIKKIKKEYPLKISENVLWKTYKTFVLKI